MNQICAEIEPSMKPFKTSRSELYSRVQRAFADLHAPEPMTEAMNVVSDAVGPEPDGFTGVATHYALNRAEWLSLTGGWKRSYR